MTFNIPGKYIILILLPVSVIINFLFFEISFESFFVGFITFSFSVSSYDLFKYFRRIHDDRKKEWFISFFLMMLIIFTYKIVF